MLEVGINALDSTGKFWPGGRYYLQHLIACVASLPAEQRPLLYDTYWVSAPEDDPFAEVRSFLSGRKVFQFPATTTGRVLRKLRRLLTRRRDSADVLVGIDVTFPTPIIENQGVPLVYWLPDLQYLHHPSFYSPEHLARMQQTDSSRVEQAARVVVSSEWGRLDAERAFPAHASKFDVVRFCSVPGPEWWQLDPASYCNDRGFPERFFALSNQFTENKNHLVCVKAAHFLREQGQIVQIVCTGSTLDFRGRDYFGTVRRYVEEHGLADQIHFVGLLPRSEQIAILRRSLAFLQPSRFEGWSTIVEDGKTLGKVIIASDFGVHLEQLGSDHPWFVSPDDVAGWASVMSRMAIELNPGPDAEEEARAAEALKRRMKETGSALVRSFHRATLA